MNAVTKHLVEMADGTLKEKELLPEAEETGMLDTDRFLYELCGGDYDSRKNPLGYYYHYAGLEARNLITGYNKDKKEAKSRRNASLPRRAGQPATHKRICRADV